MRRLWVQLTLAFALVTLASVAVAALLANSRMSAEFRGFLAQSQIQDSGLLDELAAFYQAGGSWDGVGAFLAARPGPGWSGGGHGMMHGAPELLLADRGGLVVYSTAGATGMPLPDGDRATALPVTAGGATVGWLAVRSSAPMGLLAERFLAQVNRALVQAGLAGALLGALLGLLVARGLSAPLDRLAAAARELAHGDLARRVPVGGPAEVADAGRAFNEMAGALETAEELRRRMVADIAHELRTPLTVVQGSLQAILDGVYPLDRQEIATIHDETLLLARLVEDLRELALAEAGQLRMQPQPLDVAGLLQQGAAAFQALAAEKGVALQLAVAEALPAAWADPERCAQVVRNLLANALRHTPPGGVITVGASLAGPLVIDVADSGPGIAPADLPHVFERFWRADPARAREQGGTGLGLAIARQIVRAQGGEIGVESAPGQGSRFWFSLPVAAAQPGAPPGPIPPVDAATASGRSLDLG